MRHAWLPGPWLKVVFGAGALLLATSLSAPSATADSPRGGEIGVVIGEVGTDQDITDDSSSADLTFGLIGGAVFTPHWSWHLDTLYASVPTQAGLGDATILSQRATAQYTFTPDRVWRWFLNAGAGRMSVNYEDSEVHDFDRLFVSGGGGARYEIGDLRSLRFELRLDNSVGDEGLQGADLMQGQLLVGYVWGPGTRSAPLSGPSPTRREPKPSPPPPPSKPAVAPPGVEPPAASLPPIPPPAKPSAAPVVDDEDLDGVKNRRDQCPATPHGAVVDDDGCPRDDDRDGVPNGIDHCPATPLRDPVDPRGCSADSDGDGVPDSSDSCPGTPAGAVVEEWGCPRDSDGDGAPNGLDRCPATPPGAWVDATGCPLDTDGDGVYDGIDRCPATPKGSAIDDRGCPK